MIKGLYFYLIFSFLFNAYAHSSETTFEYFGDRHENESNNMLMPAFNWFKGDRSISIFNKNYYPELALNYYFDGYTSFEAGLYTGKFYFGYKNDLKPPAFGGFASSYTIDFYTNFRDNVVIGPKYSFMLFILAIELGISAAAYTDFNDFGIYLRPFAGINIIGIISLNIGYNNALAGYSLKEINFYSLQLKFRI